MPQLACWSREDERHAEQIRTQMAAWSLTQLIPAEISQNPADL